jgi:hypothetical protein
MRSLAPLLLVGAASGFTSNAARHATPRVAAVRMGLETVVAALPTTEPIKQAVAAVPLPEELVTGLAVAPYAALAALVARAAFERLLVPLLCSSGSAEQEGSLKSQQFTRCAEPRTVAPAPAPASPELAPALTPAAAASWAAATTAPCTRASRATRPSRQWSSRRRPRRRARANPNP